MTPARFKAIREAWQLSIRGLARLVDRHETNIREMESGDRAIPHELGEWIAKLGEWLRRNPPPGKTR